MVPTSYNRAWWNRGRRWAEHKALAHRLDPCGWVNPTDLDKGVAEQLGNLLRWGIPAAELSRDCPPRKGELRPKPRQPMS